MTGFSRILKARFEQFLSPSSNSNHSDAPTVFVTLGVTVYVFLSNFAGFEATSMQLINGLTKIFFSDPSLTIQVSRRVFEIVHLVIRIFS